MQIELGKRYVTRSGLLTDVMADNVFDLWPFRADLIMPNGVRISRTWATNGEYINDGKPHPLDLASEYVQEPKPMKIEEGKRYKTRSGATTSPVVKLQRPIVVGYPFGASISILSTYVTASWDENGSYITGKQNSWDLVSEYEAPSVENCIEKAIADAKEEVRQNLVASMYGQPIQSQSYVQQLAAKHIRPAVALLNSDPAFAEAATKLSEMLAHAFLENPKARLRRRKKSQSVMLWTAACILLGRAGVGVAYDDNELELRK